jgi:hypothetical protein
VGGQNTGVEFLSLTWGYLSRRPSRQDAVLRTLAEHAEEDVRQWVPWLREQLRRQQEPVPGVEELRRTSPLRPGNVLSLSGGYDAGFSHPAWLCDREDYKATFIDFAQRGAGKMPSALVELDTVIDVTEGGGLRHRGRFAVLKLLYAGGRWGDTETVTVHVVEAPPPDHESFYASHPFGTEIELHATYRIVKNSDGTSALPGNEHHEI